MDKHNLDSSSNMNSKVSGPLRESELLDLNKRAPQNTRNFNESELQKNGFMQSHERRLPLSKISSDNSGFHHDRLMNGIENNIAEIPEEINYDENRGSSQTNYTFLNESEKFTKIREDYINQEMQYDYPESMEDEPVPKNSLPLPQPMVTDYKAARDQKKWQKVNSGFSMLYC